jgi:hypothetical protein
MNVMSTIVYLVTASVGYYFKCITLPDGDACPVEQRSAQHILRIPPTTWTNLIILLS